ncbi:MAG: TRAP transporter substrate-binding protein DctP [Lachnospiraceae bacterium]|nr:TRAP transporter substrate-binding protein DctP [Lachnospiraceae bacterium]
MKKKIAAAVISAVMALSLAACGGSEAASTSTEGGDASADPEVTLVMAEVNPLDTIVGMTDVFFAEKVEELSGGTVHIDLQDSGVLGAEQDVLDAMLGGDDSIDISRISAFALSSYGCSKATLLSIPFTWESRDHFWAFAESDLAEEFLAEPSELALGVTGVFYGEEGFRHFFFKEGLDIKGLEDLNGLKIRVSNDPVMNGMVKGLGASPTVVSFGELYSALQTGVVDAAEQPIANYKSNSFQEVAPTLLLDGHTLGAIQVIISEASLSELTEAQQNAIFEAGKLAEEYNKSISQEKENEVLDELKAGGCNVVEVSDLAPWREACAAVIEENTSDQADLYQQLLDLA